MRGDTSSILTMPTIVIRLVTTHHLFLTHGEGQPETLLDNYAGTRSTHGSG